jgi:hypothetical protein
MALEGGEAFAAGVALVACVVLYTGASLAVSAPFAKPAASSALGFVAADEWAAGGFPEGAFAAADFPAGASAAGDSALADLAAGVLAAGDFADLPAGDDRTGVSLAGVAGFRPAPVAGFRPAPLAGF